MKKTSLVITAAVAASALAGCGDAKLTARYTIAPPTTLTIASANTGDTVRCTNHGVTPSAKIPAAGHGVSNSADGRSSAATLTLTRNSDGSLAVSCTP
jgi:hypothetical protein